MQTNLLKGKAVTRGISLPQMLHDALVERAQAEDRKVSTVVKRALVNYLESEPNRSQQQQGDAGT